MAEYDAIVVGAGPGGSSAAYFLARSGARVLILDKKAFPRAKTCGDGLTPRSVKVLEEIGIQDHIHSYQRVRGLRVVGAGRTLEMDWPQPSGSPGYGLVRARKEMDQDLVQRAVSAGAELWTETEAMSPVWGDEAMRGVNWVRKQKAEGGGVEKVDEGTATAPVTVIADGAASPFARRMGLLRESSYPMGLAIRTYYRSERHNDDFFESWLEVKRGDVLLPGYGWIFPMGDGTVNIGIGLLSTFGSWRSVNLNQLQRWYIEALPSSYGITHAHQTEPYKSGRLPMAASMVRPFGPGYLLIGDAAGMVNPFNGEGIAYALETGKLAAGIITEALRSGDSPSFKAYHVALNDTYGAYYRLGRKFTKIIGDPRAFRLLCQVGMRSQTMMEFVFQCLANLAEAEGGGLGDRAFRRIVRLAERDLPDLPDPQIPTPSTARSIDSKAGAA